MSKIWALVVAVVFGLGAAAHGAHAASLNIQYDISSSSAFFGFVGQPLTFGTMTLSYQATGINGPVLNGPATLQTLMLNFATPSTFTIQGDTFSAVAPIQLSLAIPLTGRAYNVLGTVAFSAFGVSAPFNMAGSLFCAGASCPSPTITGVFPVTTLFVGFATANGITGGGPADLFYGMLVFDDYMDFAAGRSVLTMALVGNEVARSLPEPSTSLLRISTLLVLAALAVGTRVAHGRAPMRR